MSRNQGSPSVGNRKQEQRGEQRDNDRQPRHLGQDERRLILGDGAGPADKRIGFDPSMMARIQVAPGVEVKAAAGRLLEVGEAGKTDEAGYETDTDQEACNQQDQSRRLTRSFAGMYEVEFAVHQIHLSSKRAITIHNRNRGCLPLYAHGYYSFRHEPAGRSGSVPAEIAGTDVECGVASERERVAICRSHHNSRNFETDGIGHTHEGHGQQSKHLLAWRINCDSNNVPSGLQ